MKKIISPSEIRPGVYRFSAWQSIAPTYIEAVEKIFAAIEDTRPFTNYMTLTNLRETPRKQELLARATKDGVIELEVQTGQKYKGISPQEARASFADNECGLGIYEAACIVLAKPELLTKWEDLGLDCAGDEYDYPVDGARFSGVPCLCFNDGRLRANSRWFGNALGRFGAASAFLPQSNLEA